MFTITFLINNILSNNFDPIFFLYDSFFIYTQITIFVTVTN